MKTQHLSASPALDDRKGSNVLRALRQEVHTALLHAPATTHSGIALPLGVGAEPPNGIHIAHTTTSCMRDAAWLVKNDALKKQLRAESWEWDAQRDWKYIQRDRTLRRGSTEAASCSVGGGPALVDA